MKFKLAILLSLFSLPLLAAPPATQPQKPTVVWDGVTPRRGTTIANTPITIMSATTIQTGPRYDCLFVNTSLNVEFIEWGEVANINSIPVYPGDAWSCTGPNGVTQDFLSIFDPIGSDTYLIYSTILQQY
jgi:hypothetical protein